MTDEKPGSVLTLRIVQPEPGRWYCDRCKANTVWERLKRGSTRERCCSCKKNVFPCVNACQHLDCAAARDDMKKGTP